MVFWKMDKAGRDRASRPAAPNMPRRMGALVFCLVLFLSVWAVPARARVYIDIDQPFAKKLPVAVPAFMPLSGEGAGEGGFAESLTQRMTGNLDRCGIFVVLDPRTFIEGNPRAGLSLKEQINFREWLTIGAELLIKGAYTAYGDELSLELRLFDAFEGRMMLGKRYTGSIQDARKMINLFTNEILYVLTGERGVFGSQIVFVGKSGGHKDLFVAEFGGDEPRQLTQSPGNSTLPVVSRDGGRVIYQTRAPREYQVRVADMSGGSQVVHGGKALLLSPAFMPGGGYLVSISGRYSTHIHRLDAQGKIQGQVTRFGTINISPSVSPEGSQMAYVSNQAGGPQVYISSITGEGSRRVTMYGRENTDPCWSPRGDRIVYVGNSRDIFTIKPDGTDVQQLTSDSGANTRPSWSPDGRMIVFASTRLGRPALFTMSANGEKQTPLLPDYEGVQSTPFWSPAKP
ncbi:MAG: hypothetical protein KKB20_03770 [Proteobacteria bacterium]|nr:hypothetical protein [Pseudomonadota bacterium]